MTATGRLLTCAALAIALSGVSPTLARATDPEGTKTREVNNEWTGTDSSPCTGESINLEGKEVLTTRQRDSGGKTYFKHTSYQSGTGTVPNSPNRYKYSNFAENEFRTTSCKFTSRFENRKKIMRVNRQPLSNDDYFLYHMETHKFDQCQLIQVDREKTKSGCK